MLTLADINREPHWVWAYGLNPECQRSRPVALVPFIIRWGPNVSPDTLRRNLVCSECGHRGALIQHVSWVDTICRWQAWPG
jgi:hypothetical protein